MFTIKLLMAKHLSASYLNIFWQIPQFMLVGASEVLANITGTKTTGFCMFLIVDILRKIKSFDRKRFFKSFTWELLSSREVDRAAVSPAPRLRRLMHWLAVIMFCHQYQQGAYTSYKMEGN